MSEDLEDYSEEYWNSILDDHLPPDLPQPRTLDVTDTSWENTPIISGKYENLRPHPEDIPMGLKTAVGQKWERHKAKGLGKDGRKYRIPLPYERLGGQIPPPGQRLSWGDLTIHTPAEQLYPWIGTYWGYSIAPAAMHTPIRVLTQILGFRLSYGRLNVEYWSVPFGDIGVGRKENFVVYVTDEDDLKVKAYLVEDYKLRILGHKYWLHDMKTDVYHDLSHRARHPQVAENRRRWEEEKIPLPLPNLNLRQRPPDWKLGDDQ